MNSAVQAALISSGAALLIAVIGVLATSISQARSAARAQRNALELFAAQVERQAEAQKRDHKEQLRLSHVEIKRQAYARFMSAVSERADNKPDYEDAQNRLRMAQASGAPELDLLKLTGEVMNLAGKMAEYSDEVVETFQTLLLIAPRPVAYAAGSWLDADDAEGVSKGWNEFLNRAREDLGSDDVLDERVGGLSAKPNRQEQ